MIERTMCSAVDHLNLLRPGGRAHAHTKNEEKVASVEPI